METVKITAPINTWKLNGETRQYITATLPYKQAREVFKPDLYNANTGAGEQRSIFPSHARVLRKEILSGNYTPTSIGVGLTDKVKVERLLDKVTLTLDSGSGHLPLIDGGHRFQALEQLIEAGVEGVLDLPVTALIYLDTRNKENFLNLQKGRAVDKAHMLSLQVNAGLSKRKNSEYLKTALEIARVLNADVSSPFYNQIRFDSRGGSGIPISTLCAQNGSDLSTSLVGLAKIAEKNNEKPLWAASALIDIYQAIKADAPELLELGRVLTPPPNGSRGAATMWIGLGILLAYRLTISNHGNEVSKLVAAARKVCDYSPRGNFSGPKKREIMKDLAYEFLGDIDTVPFYKDEIPQPLVDTLGYSTFSLKKPAPAKKEKPKGKRGRKPKLATVTTPAEESYTSVPPSDVEVTEELADGTVVQDDENEVPAWARDTVEEEVQA